VYLNALRCGYEDVFCIIKGVQMGDVDVSDEPSSNRSRREDDS
jgi:hypothetical protein